MKPFLFIAALTLAATAGAAGGRPADDRVVIDGIRFALAPATGADQPARRLELSSEAGRHDITIEPGELIEGRGADGADGSARFTLLREAGALVCAGSATVPGASVFGTCSFSGSAEYERALATRGVKLARREQLLGLALVDADTALVDDLAREGYRIAQAEDLMAVAALDISAAYVRELKAAGVRPAAIGKLLACRALAVDGAFLRRMALAGYPSLTADEAIRMRAVGVTPEYAATMNRVFAALREVDGIGGLQ